MRTAALYRKITRDTKTETKIQTPSAESAKENFAALRLAPTAALQTKNIMGLTHSTRLCLLRAGRSPSRLPVIGVLAVLPKEMLIQ
jgi:hypothetical protein